LVDPVKHLTLFEHQRVGAKFLLDTPRAALWMPMGGGKTPTVLSVLDMLKIAGSNFFPALVIAPKRVAQVVWTGERDKWDAFQGLTITKILGERDDRLKALRRKTTDIYVINYDNVQWLVELFAARSWPFKIVIGDESTKLKNFRLRGGGRRSTALSHIAKHTGRWINLTGTPITNGLTDLWGQTWFLDFGHRLGRTYTQFLNRWFQEDPYSRRVVTLPGADKEIHNALKDITLAFKLEDILPDVKEPLRVPVEVELPPGARKLYDRMEREFFIELMSTPEGIEAPTAMAKSMKLLQLASGAIYDADRITHDVHDAKIEALQEIAENTDENLLVAYHFKFDIVRIRRAFPEARVLETERDIDDWNAGRIKMLLAHPLSAGHGIDLARGGRNIVFFTHTWDLELRQQIIERLGAARQVQIKSGLTVRIYDIIAKETLDVDVLERTTNKLTVQQALMLARSRR
jgi:SNF2 family DNA or RNA helicase